MGVLSAVSVPEIKARGSIKDADVLKLRRSYYEDGCICVEEAETILALHDACPIQDPAWADCFIETITDYIVEQAEPRGISDRRECGLADAAHRQGRADRQQDRT